MNRSLARLLLAMTIALAVAAWFVPQIASAGTAVLQGTQTTVSAGDPCYDGNAVESDTMSGGLVGCWYFDTFNVTDARPSGTIKADGVDHFVGCIDANGNGSCDAGEPSGTFSSTYTFTGKYDESGAELHGRCHHVIATGTGDFAGASGLIDFIDDVTNGTKSYTGSIEY